MKRPVTPTLSLTQSGVARSFRTWLLAFLLAQLAPLEAAGHDWYSGLRSPDGESCCNERDCHELDWAEVRRSADGILEILVGGRWLAVPFGAILSMRSPNDHIHACWPPDATRIRCVILPPEV